MNLLRCFGLRHELTMVGVVIVVACGCCLGQEAEEATDEVWSVRSYHLPAGVIDSWVKSSESGLLRFSGMPLEDAGSKEIEEYIRSCTDLLAPGVNDAAGPLPVGTLMTASSERSELSIRTCESVHTRLTELAASWLLLSRSEHTIETTLEVVEADTSLVSELMARAAILTDHKELLRQLEDAMNRGVARRVATQQLSASRGGPAKGSSGGASTIPEALRKKRNGTLVFAMVDDDPELTWSWGASWDPAQLACLVDYDLAMRSPVESLRQIKVGTPDGDKMVIPVEDRHLVHLQSSLKMPMGGTQLLGVWSGSDSHRKRLAFVGLRLFLELSAESQRLADWLLDHGEKVEPTPHSIEYQKDIPPLLHWKVPEGMELRKFRVHPESSIVFGGELPSIDDSVDSGPNRWAANAGADPFASRLISKKTAVAVFQDAGIAFPEGAIAVLNPRTMECWVIQTPEALKQIEKWIKLDWQRGPFNVTGILRIVEADGAAMRAWMNNDGGAREFKSAKEDLTKVGFHVLEESCVRTSVRGWGRVELGLDFHHWSGKDNSERDGAQSDEKSSSESFELGSIESRTVGLEWSMMPLRVRRQGPVELGVSVSFDTAPPEEQNQHAVPGVRFFEETIETHVTVPDGGNRLIGVWKPATREGGKGAAVLHAAFLEIHVTKAGW